MELIEISYRERIKGYVFEESSSFLELRHYYVNEYGTYTYDVVGERIKNIYLANLEAKYKEKLLKIAKSKCPKGTKKVYYSY